jgi:hypothetical protein
MFRPPTIKKVKNKQFKNNKMDNKFKYKTMNKISKKIQNKI